MDFWLLLSCRDNRERYVNVYAALTYLYRLLLLTERTTCLYLIFITRTGTDAYNFAISHITKNNSDSDTLVNSYWKKDPSFHCKSRKCIKAVICNPVSCTQCKNKPNYIYDALIILIIFHEIKLLKLPGGSKRVLQNGLKLCQDIVSNRQYIERS